jgi:hypothetical protein
MFIIIIIKVATTVVLPKYVVGVVVVGVIGQYYDTRRLYIFERPHVAPLCRRLTGAVHMCNIHTIFIYLVAHNDAS